MNRENLAKLREKLAAVPAQFITLREPGGCHRTGVLPGHGPMSLAGWATHLIRADFAAGVIPDADLEPPSLAAFFALTYEDVMALFYMQPKNQPHLTRAGLKRLGDGCMEAFENYRPETRHAVLLTLLDIAIATGEINWYEAKRRNDVEVAA